MSTGSAALGFLGLAPIVDTLVKERLTGAIILVAAIVVLVPELLSGPIHPAARRHEPASSAEEPPLRSYTINLTDEPAPAAAASLAARTPQPVPAAAPAEHTELATPPAPASTTPEPTTPAPAVTAAPAAGTGTSGYLVQLGSFASRSNAERLAQQVHGLGFPVSVSRGTTGRRLYRVQVGPARDRAAAEQMAAKLRAQGHRGTVVPK
jgi:DedD protein